MKNIKSIAIAGASLISILGAVAVAQDAGTMLAGYEKQAKAESPGFKGFSPERGKDLYFMERKASDGKTVSCSTCHTSDARQSGKTRAGKVIEPLAPSANPARFTDEAKTEKWFRRNCRDVLERDCTAKEKGDFIAYLRSLK